MQTLRSHSRKPHACYGAGNLCTDARWAGCMGRSSSIHSTSLGELQESWVARAALASAELPQNGRTSWKKDKEMSPNVLIKSRCPLSKSQSAKSSACQHCSSGVWCSVPSAVQRGQCTTSCVGISPHQHKNKAQSVMYRLERS